MYWMKLSRVLIQIVLHTHGLSILTEEPLNPPAQSAGRPQSPHSPSWGLKTLLSEHLI
jgi:hypothetical protein